jgi:hypothetical protein
MKHFIKAFIFLFILSFSNEIIQAQTSTATTGGNAFGAEGTVSYTIGQVVYTTNNGSTGSAIQGVQQPYEISIITGTGEVEGIELNFIAYPNPASDFFTLKIENYTIENLSYKLFDAYGKIQESEKVSGNKTTISMINKVPGVYLLKNIDNQKEIKSFKIIKY